MDFEISIDGGRDDSFGDGEQSQPNSSRSLRNRKSHISYAEESSSTPPKKKKVDKSPQQTIEEIYKQVADVKAKSTSLETIYEQPKNFKDPSRNYMTGVKTRRSCALANFYNPGKNKQKLRKERAKKLKRLGVKVPTGDLITLEQVQAALDTISDDEEEEENDVSMVSVHHINVNTSVVVTSPKRDIVLPTPDHSPFVSGGLIIPDPSYVPDICAKSIPAMTEEELFDLSMSVVDDPTENDGSTLGRRSGRKGRRSGGVKDFHKSVLSFRKEAAKNWSSENSLMRSTNSAQSFPDKLKQFAENNFCEAPEDVEDNQSTNFDSLPVIVESVRPAGENNIVFKISPGKNVSDYRNSVDCASGGISYKRNNSVLLSELDGVLSFDLTALPVLHPSPKSDLKYSNHNLSSSFSHREQSNHNEAYENKFFGIKTPSSRRHLSRGFNCGISSSSSGEELTSKSSQLSDADDAVPSTAGLPPTTALKKRRVSGVQKLLYSSHLGVSSEDSGSSNSSNNSVCNISAVNDETILKSIEEDSLVRSPQATIVIAATKSAEDITETELRNIRYLRKRKLDSNQPHSCDLYDQKTSNSLDSSIITPLTSRLKNLKVRDKSDKETNLTSKFDARIGPTTLEIPPAVIEKRRIRNASSLITQCAPSQVSTETELKVSPSSLMSQLYIVSPATGTASNEVDAVIRKKNRRRSARLQLPSPRDLPIRRKRIESKEDIKKGSLLCTTEDVNEIECKHNRNTTDPTAGLETAHLKVDNCDTRLKKNMNSIKSLRKDVSVIPEVPEEDVEKLSIVTISNKEPKKTGIISKITKSVLNSVSDKIDFYSPIMTRNRRRESVRLVSAPSPTEPTSPQSIPVELDKFIPDSMPCVDGNKAQLVPSLSTAAADVISSKPKRKILQANKRRRSVQIKPKVDTDTFDGMEIDNTSVKTASHSAINENLVVCEILISDTAPMASLEGLSTSVAAGIASIPICDHQNSDTSRITSLEGLSTSVAEGIARIPIFDHQNSKSSLINNNTICEIRKDESMRVDGSSLQNIAVNDGKESKLSEIQCQNIVAPATNVASAPDHNADIDELSLKITENELGPIISNSFLPESNEVFTEELQQCGPNSLLLQRITPRYSLSSHPSLGGEYLDGSPKSIRKKTITSNTDINNGHGKNSSNTIKNKKTGLCKTSASKSYGKSYFKVHPALGEGISNDDLSSSTEKAKAFVSAVVEKLRDVCPKTTIKELKYSEGSSPSAVCSYQRSSSIDHNLVSTNDYHSSYQSSSSSRGSHYKTSTHNTGGGWSSSSECGSPKLSTFPCVGSGNDSPKQQGGSPLCGIRKNKIMLNDLASHEAIFDSPSPETKRRNNFMDGVLLGVGGHFKSGCSAGPNLSPSDAHLLREVVDAAVNGGSSPTLLKKLINPDKNLVLKPDCASTNLSSSSQSIKIFTSSTSATCLHNNYVKSSMIATQDENGEHFTKNSAVITPETCNIHVSPNISATANILPTSIQCAPPNIAAAANVVTPSPEFGPALPSVDSPLLSGMFNNQVGVRVGQVFINNQLVQSNDSKATELLSTFKIFPHQR